MSKVCPILMETLRNDDMVKTTLNYDFKNESKPYIDPNCSVIQNKERENRTIFIEKISNQTTKSELLKIFAKYGKIEKFWMKNLTMEDQEKMSILKNCYIMFAQKEFAKSAVESARFVELNDSKMQVTFANEVEKGTRRSIFIGNIDRDCTEVEISNLLKNVGKIEFIKVLREKSTNKSKRICFVKFEDELSVPIALKLDNFEWNGFCLRVIRNAKNSENILKSLNACLIAKVIRINAEELQEIKQEVDQLVKSKDINESNYGVTMMENLIKHQGKVPSVLISKKLKKLKKGNFDERTMSVKVAQIKETALNKLNKEVFEKDNLLKIRRDLRKAKMRNNKMMVKNSQKASKKDKI